MCLARRNLTPKARGFLVSGCLCLAVGSSLSVFGRDLGVGHQDVYDALRGFLLGLAIAFNFCALRLARNGPKSQV